MIFPWVTDPKFNDFSMIFSFFQISRTFYEIQWFFHDLETDLNFNDFSRAVGTLRVCGELSWTPTSPCQEGGIPHTGGFNLWWLDSTVRCRYNVVSFLTNIHKKAPHSSLAGARYGVTFVCSPSDWYSASVPAISCAISYHIGPHYNGTRQVFSITLVVTLTLNQHTVNVHWICTGCCWQYSETSIAIRACMSKFIPYFSPQH